MSRVARAVNRGTRAGNTLLWEILDKVAGCPALPWDSPELVTLFQAQSPPILTFVLLIQALFLPKVLVSLPSNAPLSRKPPCLAFPLHISAFHTR